LKACQLQFSLVNLGEYQLVSKFFNIKDINIQKARLTSLTSINETWISSKILILIFFKAAFNSVTGTFNADYNLFYFKKEYTKENLETFYKANPEIPRQTSEPLFNDWKIISSYVKNFFQIENEISCPIFPGSSISNSFSFSEGRIPSIDQNANTITFLKPKTLKKNNEVILTGQRGYEIITIDEDLTNSLTFKIKRGSPALNFTTNQQSFGFTSSINRIPPSTWVCDVRHYYSGDGCHCNIITLLKKR
jgi:hypothetical protein